MAVYIRGNRISTGSNNSNSGLYIGQNIQYGWDSLSPDKSATSFIMGDCNVSWSFASGFFNLSYINQWVNDNDVKGNQSMWIARSRL